MDYQLYLFDFDYTLANSEKGIVTCFRQVFESEGYRGISDEQICRTIGLTLEEAFMQMTGVRDRAVIERYRRAYVEAANSIMTQNTVLYPETVPMLEKLKAAGKKTGIISTKYRYRIEETLQKYRITALIDKVIGGEDVCEAKPSPEGILKAAAFFQVDQKAVLYTGDSIVDAQTAVNAGVAFAAVTTGATPKASFLDYPHIKIMQNLSEI